MTSSSLNPYGHITNGILTGLTAAVVMQPAYTVQTYITTRRGFPPITTLYRGFAINALCDVSSQAVTFMAYGLFSQYLSPTSASKTQESLMGFGAGVAAAPLISACERIMILQQIHGGTAAILFKKITLCEGNAGIFKGSLPTLAREAIFSATLFGVSDNVAEYMQQNIPNENVCKFTACMSTGTLVGAVTTPLNTIKILMQETLGASSMLKTTQKLVAEHGVKGCFHGIVPRSLLIGGLMVTMEIAKDFFPSLLPPAFHVAH